MRELVVDSNSARKMRGVNGADVVEDSVCTITRSRRTLKTYGLGSRSATLFRASGAGAQFGLKIPDSIVL